MVNSHSRMHEDANSMNYTEPNVRLDTWRLWGLVYLRLASYMSAIPSLGKKGTRPAMEQTNKRVKYGFGDFKLGDAWRYYSVSLARIRSAAQMFGQRHGMKFKVRQEGKSVLVERLA